MDNNRKTAYLTLMDVETKHAYSNLALNHRIIRGRPDSSSFVRRLVYGVLENKIYLDYIIDSLSDKGIKKIRKSELTILRMGIYQIDKMDSVPEYAAVNESVALAKKFAKNNGGFVNAMLRSFIRERYNIKLPDRSEDEIMYLSTKYSYEPWIIELWLDVYDVEFVEQLLEAGNESLDTTIRINTTKARREDLEKQLNERGYKVTKGKIAKTALHVEGSDIIDSDLYKNGLFSIQDESSQMVAEILDPAPKDFIIDVCAAPGGKTLAIAEKMESKGEIFASDIYKRKVDIIDREAYRLGLSNIHTRTWDGTRVDSNLIEKADKVLVDAPCSGLGVIRRKPEIRYKKKSEETLRLPELQLNILSAASKYVVQGGLLMYSTCTISPYENERVVKDFIRKNSMFEVEEMKQYLPNVDGVDGFFICKMRKDSSLI